jgi:hypothetical protein
MGMMEIIEGVSAKDMGKVERMTDVKEACEAAGISVPEEVEKYLELEHEIVGKLRPGIDKGITSTEGEGEIVIEIDLSKIDKKIDIIRITKTW